MVPDVHHVLAKAGGVFCSPASAAAPAKLRLLYECAPLALIVEVRFALCVGWILQRVRGVRVLRVQ